MGSNLWALDRNTTEIEDGDQRHGGHDFLYRLPKLSGLEHRLEHILGARNSHIIIFEGFLLNDTENRGRVEEVVAAYHALVETVIVGGFVVSE